MLYSKGYNAPKLYENLKWWLERDVGYWNYEIAIASKFTEIFACFFIQQCLPGAFYAPRHSRCIRYNAEPEHRVTRMKAPSLFQVECWCLKN